MLKIVTAPNPVLSEIAKPVIKVNGFVSKLIKDMEKALLSAKDPLGVGLAAPQVGKPLRIFIAKPTSKSKISVFINPKITQKSEISHASSSKKSKDAKLEGCLSLPNIWGEVKRDLSIKISYLNGNGKEYRRELNGFMATIIQHEIDHLDGILFPKRVLEQKGTLYKSHKNEKGQDIFEEIEI